MTQAVTLALAASGLFLLAGLVGGVLKYHGIVLIPISISLTVLR